MHFTERRCPFFLLFALMHAACGSDGEHANGAADGDAATGGTAGSVSNDASMQTGGSGGGSETGGTTSGGTGGTGSGGAAGTPASLDCAPLPPPSGSIVIVDPSQAAELSQIVYDAAPGTTILLADGVYTLSAGIQAHQRGLTLRSESSNAAQVILDAAYAVNEAIAISASDVTVAHLTIEHAIDHPIHAYTGSSGEDVTGILLYDLRLIDGGEQFVKVNPGTAGGYVDQGRIECSFFELTDAGRPNVEPCCGGCYTGGIDVHAGWGWIVRNNRFESIHCPTGLAEHAIHFWKGARDTLVENNVIVDCARGIGFGLDGGEGDRLYPDTPYGGELLAHYDGIIRNNVIWADHASFDTGIELHIARRPVVVHNTVVSGAGATAFFSSIDYRFAATDAFIANNLTNRITLRDGASATLETNLENTPLSYFVDAQALDFHLAAAASEAIDRATPHAEAGLDLDGDPHDPMLPDIGADER